MSVSRRIFKADFFVPLGFPDKKQIWTPKSIKYNQIQMPTMGHGTRQGSSWQINAPNLQPCQKAFSVTWSIHMLLGMPREAHFSASSFL